PEPGQPRQHRGEVRLYVNGGLTAGQNIASSLQLALSTVKAHVHNILKKTDTTTRQELTQLFWKG
ncbi:LuxR C-terminal-related transcriptional regulator, partial [Adlercreutzia muris]|uniref:LuxR C-terminal-related transcriptional regulator n=1 Tax=Adlercreutzia muris TaxID=1796610 RepID=UPI001EEF1852